MDVTSQPRATAYLQIREPRKPLPPQTTSFLAADMGAQERVTRMKLAGVAKRASRWLWPRIMRDSRDAAADGGVVEAEMNRRERIGVNGAAS